MSLVRRALQLFFKTQKNVYIIRLKALGATHLLTPSPPSAPSCFIESWSEKSNDT
jgi:hypothetical protein